VGGTLMWTKLMWATLIDSQYGNSIGPRPQVFSKVFLNKSSIKDNSHPTSISHINNNVAHTNRTNNEALHE